MLGLCAALRHVQAPVSVVFFDREETWLRTPLFRFGLLGSAYYARRCGQSIAAVYNLEFCGQGDFLAIWPIRDNETQLPTVRAVNTAATGLGIPFANAHIPWLALSSDHLSFRLRGIRNAVTLSLLPRKDVPEFEKLIHKMSVPKLLIGRRPRLPEPLVFIHTAEDTSSRLEESSLQLMLSLLRELVRDSPANVVLGKSP